MFAKTSCQHCNGHIEDDSTYEGITVECPHCSEPTKLKASEIPKTPLEPKKLNTPETLPDRPQSLIITDIYNLPPEKPTKLIIPDTPTISPERDRIIRYDNDDWRSDPMSEKQKGMLALYGVPITEGLTKGEASILIENALQSETKPTTESQAKASEIWGSYRLKEVVEEINRAIQIISDTTVTIKTLKETKANVKESVRKFTEQIDRRIQTKQDENWERRYAKDDL
jgi:hypothetical protein